LLCDDTPDALVALAYLSWAVWRVKQHAVNAVVVKGFHEVESIQVVCRLKLWIEIVCESHPVFERAVSYEWINPDAFG